jgi:hypothetical protein
MEKKKIYILQAQSGLSPDRDVRNVSAYLEKFRADDDAEYLNDQANKSRFGYGAQGISKKEWDLIVQEIWITDPYFSPWYDRFIVTEMDIVG